jgi:hypothetical protein
VFGEKQSTAYLGDALQLLLPGYNPMSSLPFLRGTLYCYKTKNGVSGYDPTLEAWKQRYVWKHTDNKVEDRVLYWGRLRAS